MGIDFIRRAAPSFHKGLDRRRVELATPTLFMQEPACAPRAYAANLRSGQTLTAGEKLGVRLDGKQVVALRGLDRSSHLQQPTRRADGRSPGVAWRGLRVRSRSPCHRPGGGDYRMLIQLSNSAVPARDTRQQRRLWHDGGRQSLSLGCARCPDQGVCGGLQVECGVFDCLGFCCQNPADCNTVCRKKPDEFARRVREVGGFAFSNVPRRPRRSTRHLHCRNLYQFYFTHVRESRHSRRRRSCACLCTECSVGKMAIPDMETRWISAEGFGISRAMSVILTGTATDPPLERWWSLGPLRRDAIRALRGLNIALVTTPNYSLFIDQPRWDDLHSMKRIALVHEEFLSEGLPAALHVNARTERDWSRWRDYIVARAEVTHIAFEFATGAGCAGRIEWHANELVRLAADVGRPLHLVIRGGGKVLPALMTAFSDITVLETSAFIKTMHRQRAALTSTGMVSWRQSAEQNRLRRSMPC